MDALIDTIASNLVRRGWRMSTVESCTGGMVAARLTDRSGSSDWFECGFVTYSNQAKMRDVGVDVTTLRAHGAVSTATAREMAAGGADRANTEVSVALTGIAGPGGRTSQKPVGTVCFSWYINGEVNSEQCRFEGDRDSVREQSVVHVLVRLAATLEA